MKRLVKKALYGVPLGISAGVFCLVIISAFIGGGKFYTCSTEVASVCGSEWLATVFQFLIFALVGMSFSLTSGIWKKQRWGIFWRTFAYYAVNLPAMVFLSWFNTMNGDDMVAFFVYLSIYTVLFFNIWLFQYLFNKNKQKYLLDEF